MSQSPRPRGLGRGLSALLGDEDVAATVVPRAADTAADSDFGQRPGTRPSRPIGHLRARQDAAAHDVRGPRGLGRPVSSGCCSPSWCADRGRAILRSSPAAAAGRSTAQLRTCRWSSNWATRFLQLGLIEACRRRPDGDRRAQAAAGEDFGRATTTSPNGDKNAACRQHGASLSCQLPSRRCFVSASSRPARRVR